MDASTTIPAWQQEALDKMSARLCEWLPDHKLHLVLIRAPFKDQHGYEITDPVFERLLRVDPDAAQKQLITEFEADRLVAIKRDRRLAAERQQAAADLRRFVATKRKARRSTSRHAQPSLPLH